MFPRLEKFPNKHSFFLFGPRGTGKSTLLKLRFEQENCVWFDLLDPRMEERFSLHAHDLIDIVRSLSQEKHIVIDEIQKIPKLLDIVHLLIEEKKDKIFILTGSSARKLKHGGANLLAGRAFVHHLHPLSCFELGDSFDLKQALQWGTLPKACLLKEDYEKEDFLRSYSDSYLKEEIWNEHVIRKLKPFRRFLEVAAQCNGKIINVANISKDVGASQKTVNEYFNILVDTMLGFFLESFHNSFRKRLREKPKFYFFDTGVVRSLSRMLSSPLIQQTSAFGDAFEHFVILEFIKLGSYFQPDYRFSYIRTAGDVEVDLVVDRPGQDLLCIEIKSTDQIGESHIGSFIKLTHDLNKKKKCEAVVLSQDPFLKKYDHVTCYHWKEGLMRYFPEVKNLSVPILNP